MVAVQMPVQRESEFEKLMKGVQVATTVLGIKQSFDNQAQRKTDLARQTELQKREDEDYAFKKQERDFAMKGGLAPSQQTELTAKGFTFGPAGAQGAQQAMIRTPDGQMQPVSIMQPKKETGLTAYQKEMIELEKYKVAATQTKDQVQQQKTINEGARKLADSIEKTGVSDVISALQKLDQKVGIDGDSDIPGVGLTGGLGTLTISEEGKTVRQLVQNVQNTLLKARSGGAISEGEAERLLNELGVGLTRSDADLRRGLQMVRDTLRTKLQLAESSAPEESVSTYRQRKGSIHSELDLFRPAAITEITDTDIDEELRRRSSGATASW